MKRIATAPWLFAIAALSAGNSFAYQTFIGEDGNGSSTVIRPIPNSTGAQLDFFGTSTPQVEDFENQAVGPGPLTLAFGSGNTAVNATLTGGNGAVASVATPNDGRYSVPGGTKFWEATASSSGDTFGVTFNAKVEAFGFFGIDIGDFGGNLSMELLDVAGNLMGAPIAIGGTLPVASRDGSALYFGIRADNESEWFNGIRFRLANSTAQQDVFAFDSFTVVGAPQSAPPPAGAPEPGSLALAAIALLGLGMVKRRV